MGRELVRVSFHGDTLEAVKDGERVWVSLRRCCENLGLAIQPQHEKLKSKPWACVTEIVIHDASGRQQPLTMIDLDTLPGWLFSIDGRKVKEPVREKLARYQREAARVLADHFFGRARAAPPVDVGAIVEAVFQRVRAAALPQLPPPGSMPAVPRFTVAERLRFKGWFTASKKQRHTIRRLANALLDSRFQETPDLIGGTCFYAAHQLLCLDEAIDRVREDAERDERRGGPGLYGPAA